MKKLLLLIAGLVLNNILYSQDHQMFFLSTDGRESFDRFCEYDGFVYCVGRGYNMNYEASGILAKITDNDEMQIGYISLPDTSVKISNIIPINNKLLVVGNCGLHYPDVSKQFFIGEIDANLNLLWYKTYQLSEEKAAFCNMEFVTRNDTLYIGGRLERENNYTTTMFKLSDVGDSIKYVEFNDYSKIYDLEFNVDSSGLIIFGTHFGDVGSNLQFVELDFDLNIQHISGQNYIGLHSSFSAKFDTDTTIFVANRFSNFGQLDMGFHRFDTSYNIIDHYILYEPETDDNPAWSQCMDFIDPNEVFFAVMHNDYIGFYPPAWPADLWIGIMDENLDMQGITMIESSDTCYLMNAIKVLQSGDCVVSGFFYVLSTGQQDSDAFIAYIKREDIPTGISKTIRQNIDVKIYPNPCVDQLHIELADKRGDLQLEIYNAMGEKILSRELQTEIQSIDVHGWKSGIYHYSIIQDKEILKSGSWIKL